MIKKFASGSLVVGAVTCAILVASLVPASSQQATTKKFTLCEKGNGFAKDIDVGRHGFSAGDYEVSASPVYNPSTGRRVATDIGKTTIVHRIGNRDAKVIIDATMITRVGKLTAYGPLRFSGTAKGVSFAITGGTGNYRNADGTVRVRDARCLGKSGIRLAFRLTLQ